MSIEENKPIQRQKAGRKPKSHPAIFRHTIILNEVENIEFLGRYDQSCMQVRANFITSCIFGKPLNVIKLDKGLIDYYMRLTTFYSQFRAISVNYDQVVSALKSNFHKRLESDYSVDIIREDWINLLEIINT